MRILVTGSNGLLGTKVLERLIRDPRHQALASSRGACANEYLGSFAYWPLDVTDRSCVDRVLGEAEPEIVVHTAAMTDVDGCERLRDQAMAVNAIAAGHVARVCVERGLHLVHLSTEYVFDGKSGPYREDDVTNPQGWYARSKLEGERSVIEAGGSWAIGRTTVIYGYTQHVRANFVLWLIRKLRAGEQVRVIDDQIGSPTLADNLAEMVLALATTSAQGIWNTVGASILPRYEFARLVAHVFDLDSSLIDPISTAELNQPALRPLRAGLLMDKFRSAFPKLPVLTAAEGLAVLRQQLSTAGVS